MENKDVKIGQHCWAIMENKLVVVLKDEDEGYEVCGAWECGTSAKSLTLLEIINKPKNYDETKLYYLND